ncbi:MAG TPA: SUMF1/EgtB/PvdO family nonheme iron enzyme, partial [Anaerolineales bacterium]|nr:SUMF1/EgtB/PvdO family nonheme iron enzyme [Anaerolineales bacterium]
MGGRPSTTSPEQDTLAKKRPAVIRAAGLFFSSLVLIFVALFAWIAFVENDGSRLLQTRLAGLPIRSLATDVKDPAVAPLTSTPKIAALAGLTPAVPTIPAVNLATATATTAHSPSPSPSATLPPTATPFLRTLRTEDGMPMVLIPSGTFSMGAASDDPEAEFDERPAREVDLNAFYMDQYEVSVTQYAAFLNTLGKHLSDPCLSSSCARTRREEPESHLLWDGQQRYSPEPGFENYPVNNVTWFGAEAYCEWVGARLPTEAEWEYGARGWDGRRYPWGNEPPDPAKAVYGQESFAALQPVDALEVGASFFGINQMSGNVLEWVSDWYMEDAYLLEPGTLLNPTGPVGRYRSPRVLRGGSWQSPAADLRVTARQGREPLLFDLFGTDTGFRCVRSIVSAPIN